MPYGIPPAAPRQPQKHTDPDLDIIIKLLEEIRNFMKEYINEYLPYLIHDGLEDLVPDFQQQSIPILNHKTHEVITILSKQPGDSRNTMKDGLHSVGLTIDTSLELKDRSIRGQINRFFRHVRRGITKGLTAVSEPVFKVINSFLGSLKAGIGHVPGVGAALDIIKQIKEHVEASSTGLHEEQEKRS